MNRIIVITATAALALSPVALATTTYAAPAAPLQKKATYEVTAKVNKTVAISKETILKVRGRVTPKAAGQQVVLQQRVLPKRTWKATGTTRIKSDGTYVIKDDPSTAGIREYRVVKPAAKGLGKGISDTLAVKVYGWQKLATRTPVLTNARPAGVTIATEYYDRSLVTVTSGAPASVEYTLGRKCIELRATYALTDESPTGSTGAVTVSADGAVLASHPLAIGTVVDNESLDLTGVFRLKFDLSTSATPAAAAAIATPEVLCAG